jgi:hypothetical protein
MPSLGRILVCAALISAACVSPACNTSSDQTAKPAAPTPAPAQSPLVLTVPPAVTERRTADLNEMVKKRVIRAGVVYSRTHYFIDKGVQRGAGYDSLKLFEDEINAKFKTRTLGYTWSSCRLARSAAARARRRPGGSGGGDAHRDARASADRRLSIRRGQM